MAKKLLTSFLLLIAAIASRGEYFQTEVVIDGVNYDIVPGLAYARATVVPRSVKPTGDVVIKPYIMVGGNVYTVTSIDKDAFRNNNDITSVTIPPTITHIGEGAFTACRSLKATYIEDLDAWLHADIWDSPVYLSNNLYVNGELLEEVQIPSTISVIPPVAFAGCHTLKKVHLPSTVTEIGLRAFCECTGLTEVTIPINTEYVRDQAFVFCEGIKHLNLPVETFETEMYAYLGCSSLETITTSFPWPTYMKLGRDVFMMTPKEDITVYYAEDKEFAHEVTWRPQWSEFGSFVPVPKCPTPRITFSEATNQVIVVCDAPDSRVYATVIYEDHAEEVTNSGTISMNLNGIYTINAYATAPGYYMSDEAEESITLKTPANVTTSTTQIVVSDENGVVTPASQKATPVISLGGSASKPKIMITGDTDVDHDIKYKLSSTGGISKTGKSFIVIDLDGHVDVSAQVLNYQWDSACSSHIANLGFDWTVIKISDSDDYVTLDDDARTEYVLEQDIDEVGVHYKRTFPSTGTVPFYVPFEIDYDCWSEYGKVAKMTGIEERDDNGDGIMESAHVEFESLGYGESIQPHAMYIFMANDDATDKVIEFVADATILYAAPDEPTSVTYTADTNTYTFTGSYTMLDGLRDIEAYTLSPDGRFVKASSASAAPSRERPAKGSDPGDSLEPYRFYLQVKGNGSSSTEPLRILADLDHKTIYTGIADITIDPGTSGDTYDLSGRQVGTSYRGLIIDNGQLKFRR